MGIDDVKQKVEKISDHGALELQHHVVVEVRNHNESTIEFFKSLNTYAKEVKKHHENGVLEYSDYTLFIETVLGESERGLNLLAKFSRQCLSLMNILKLGLSGWRSGK